MQKSYFLILLLALILPLNSLPFREEIALVNSLEVGRDEDPTTWACTGCDQSNKPNLAYTIEEKASEVKSELSVYDEYTVLAFRYTANLKNFIQDIVYVFQKQDGGAPKGCKVQKQYDRMWGLIKDDVIQGLKKHVHTKRLIITGISLGGGLACLSFVDIKNSGDFQNVEIVTFGSPKVGNKKWASWFDSLSESTRIYIKNDPIAFLPICFTPFCSYRQTGTAFVCNKKKEECKRKSKSEIEKEQFQYGLNDVKFLMNELNEHSQQIAYGQYGGLIDHIYNYPKIKNYTMIE